MALQQDLRRLKILAKIDRNSIQIGRIHRQLWHWLVYQPGERRIFRIGYRDI
jgi:hypothetical protein